MANLLNDTDPQSPLARISRTDPGLGDSRPNAPAEAEASPAPAPVAATPSPASTSIEELLDGITGPRPPPPSARRDAGPNSARAYVPARAVPAPQPVLPPEPLVVSPEPPLYSGVGKNARGTDEPPREPRVESVPTKPIVRRHKEEKTVYTGRRAVIRNATVMILSASIVAVMMMSIMRWREGQHPRAAAAVVVLPPQPDTDPVQAGPAVTAAPPQEAVPESAPVAKPADVAPSAVVGALRPVTSAPAPRRARVEAKPATPPSGGLDDLNRQIRH